MAEQRAILVAEGLNDSRMMMKWALEQHGYQVLEAATGEEAIEVAQREQPDLILMDLHLPELDGLEATRRIREIAALQDVPIVATSTLDSAELQAEAFAAGCTAFRRQPLDFDKFGDVADLILQRHRKSAAGSEQLSREERQ